MKVVNPGAIAKFLALVYLGMIFPALADSPFMTPPSFPCNAANTTVEKTVCSDTDGDLQRMDRTVSKNYQFLVRVMGSEGDVVIKEVHVNNIDRPSLELTDRAWRSKMNDFIKDHIAVSMYGEILDTNWNEEYLKREIENSDAIEEQYEKKLPQFVFAEYSRRLGNVNWLLYQWLKDQLKSGSLGECAAFDSKTADLTNLINYFTVYSITPVEYLVQVPCAIVSTNWMYRFVRVEVRTMEVTPLSGLIYNMEGSYFTLDFDPMTMTIHHYRAVSHPDSKTGLACVEEKYKVDEHAVRLLDRQKEQPCMVIMDRLLKQKKPD